MVTTVRANVVQVGTLLSAGVVQNMSDTFHKIYSVQRSKRHISSKRTVTLSGCQFMVHIRNLLVTHKVLRSRRGNSQGNPSALRDKLRDDNKTARLYFGRWLANIRGPV